MIFIVGDWSLPIFADTCLGCLGISPVDVSWAVSNALVGYCHGQHQDFLVSQNRKYQADHPAVLPPLEVANGCNHVSPSHVIPRAGFVPPSPTTSPSRWSPAPPNRALCHWGGVWNRPPAIGTCERTCDESHGLEHRVTVPTATHGLIMVMDGNGLMVHGCTWVNGVMV